jgi:hypothetical protein
MKKIIFINVLSLLTLTAVCQNKENSSSAVSKEMMINGIPYSQYKAQQDALKQKQSNENKTTTAPATNNHSAPQVQPAPVAAKPVEATPVAPTKPSRATGITEQKQEVQKTEAEIKAPPSKGSGK